MKGIIIYSFLCIIGCASSFSSITTTSHSHSSIRSHSADISLLSSSSWRRRITTFRKTATHQALPNYVRKYSISDRINNYESNKKKRILCFFVSFFLLSCRRSAYAITNTNTDRIRATLSLGTQLRLVSRLLMAAICGSLVGWERGSSKKSAGIRTMTLVSLGAALFTMCSAYAFPRGDPTRMAANVASGVGFLGAGVITTNDNDNTPSGLTTAAAIWMSAALGVVSALGLHLLSTVTALITVGILRLGKQHQQEEEEQSSKSKHNDDEFREQEKTMEQRDSNDKHEDDKFRVPIISIVQDSSFDSLSSLDTGRFNKIANSSHEQNPPLEISRELTELIESGPSIFEDNKNSLSQNSTIIGSSRFSS